MAEHSHLHLQTLFKMSLSVNWKTFSITEWSSKDARYKGEYLISFVGYGHEHSLWQPDMENVSSLLRTTELPSLSLSALYMLSCTFHTHLLMLASILYRQSVQSSKLNMPPACCTIQKLQVASQTSLRNYFMCQHNPEIMVLGRMFTQLFTAVCSCTECIMQCRHNALCFSLRPSLLSNHDFRVSLI